MLKLYKNEYKEKNQRRKKMKAVIAIDSLKGSLSSMEAGYAAADGIRRVHGQDAEIIVRPLADGGGRHSGSTGEWYEWYHTECDGYRSARNAGEL